MEQTVEFREFCRQLDLDPDKHYKNEREFTDTVKKAWKAKCQVHHPDKGGKSEDYLAVTHAYRMLTDIEYQHKERTRQTPVRNLNARFNVCLSFEDAFFGRMITITFNPVHINDKGVVMAIDKEKDVFMDAEIISIYAKAGTRPGEEAIVSGKGLAHGKERGDLIINFQVEPHVKFTLQGAHVQAVENVPLETMLTGGDIEVLTMYGIRTLRVPAGTTPGTQLKIQNCGVQKLGEHIVIVQPLFPEKDDLKKKSIWKKLGINWSKEEVLNAKDSDDEEMIKLFEQLGGRDSVKRPNNNTFVRFS